MENLSPETRQIVLDEIEKWRREGLISPTFAQNLSKRYRVESAKPADSANLAGTAPASAGISPIQTPPSLPAVKVTEQSLPTAPAPLPAPVKSAALSPQPKPRPTAPPKPAGPTLIQTLTSEASIKIALYLGAFLVVAAAFILAFLSETLRFPALITVTLGFGVGAFMLRKRLPQTSFTLFIVASVLMGIDAWVLSDITNLAGRSASIYWTAAFALTASVWAFATWGYKSRFFSLTCFLSVEASLIAFVHIFEPQQISPYLLALSLAALAGILVAHLLKHWQGAAFPMPLFALLQGQQIILLGATMIFGASQIINSEFGWGWVLIALAWLVSAAFYILSDTLYRFPLFRWMVVGALVPVQWLAFLGFKPELWLHAAGLWGWAFGLAAAGEVALRSNAPKLKEYALPFNLAALPVFLLGCLTGFIHNTETGFALSLAAALVLTAMHAFRSRWWVWVTALWFGLIAFFSAFQIGALPAWLDEISVQIIIATALLTLPDLLLQPDFKLQPAWRWPLRNYALILVAANTIICLFDVRPEYRAAILTVHAFLALAYAIRFNRPWLGLAFSLHTPLAAYFWLDFAHKLDTLALPVFTALAVAFYGTGLLLRWRKSTSAWTGLFRYSGLALTVLAALFSQNHATSAAGWYLFALGGLFLAETFLNNLFEIGLYPFWGLGFYSLLRDSGLSTSVYLPSGLATITLLTDMFLHHRLPKRTWAVIARAGGGIFALLAMFMTIPSPPNREHVWAMALLAALFLSISSFYRAAWVTYPATLGIVLAVAAGLRVAGVLSSAWLVAATILGISFYAAGYALRRIPAYRAWSDPYRYSGLTLSALAGIVSIPYPIPFSGGYLLALAVIFLAETFINPFFELGVHALLALGYLQFWRESHTTRLILPLTGLAVLISVLDMGFQRLLKTRPWAWVVRLGAGFIALGVLLLPLLSSPDWEQVWAMAVLAMLAVILSVFYRQPLLLYAVTATFTLGMIAPLRVTGRFEQGWLPAATGLSVAFYALGLGVFRTHLSIQWSHPLRYSALALGIGVTALGFFYTGVWSGWYVAILAWLFALETFRNSGLEIIVHLIFSVAYLLVLRENKITSQSLNLMGLAVIVLGLDTIFSRALKSLRVATIPVRVSGAIIALTTVVLATFPGFSGWQNAHALAGLAALSLGLALFHRKPQLGYAMTTTLALAVFVGARTVNPERWLWPLIGLAVLYYALSYFDKPSGWNSVYRMSGLVLATLTALSAPLEQGGLAASIPVAIAATLWAAEAFRQRNVWLGFPANSLYLMAYFMILFETGIREAQFYSVGAGLLGLLMHYLLTQSGSKTGAFITGTVSQLILLGTAYLQMFRTESLLYFVALFFEGLAVLIYGLVIRSRSLVFAPILFVVVGVITVIFSVFRNLSTVIIIGGTGILLIAAGTAALLLRERIAEIRERISDWKA